MAQKFEIQQARTASEAVRACSRRLGGPALGALALLLWLFVFASPALAAPVHLPLPGLNLSGFDHACGVATDSEGDVYVASPGETPPKVKIFKPTGNPLEPWESLGSIEEGLAGNEPCGLAVDTKGSLYVSEVKTGKVIKYEPNAYPFSGTPTYGPPTTIDSSGEAKGISVDPFDDRLYVAKGDHVAAYQSNGTLGINEVQRVTFAQASGGSFRLALPGEGGLGRNEVQRISRAFESYALTFNGQTTSSLDANASAAEVDAALEALSTIGVGDAVVTGFPNRTKWVEFTGALAETDVPLITGTGEVTAVSLSDITNPIAYGASPENVEITLEALQGIGSGNVFVEAQGTGYRITFVGGLAHTDAPGLTADPSGLTPDGSGFNPEAGAGVTTEGFSGHIGESELTDATGVAAYTYAGGDRYVFAADAATNQIKVFSGPDIRKLKLRKTINGPKPGEDFGFGSVGAYLAVDRGNENPEKKCSPIAKQACTTGHFFVYDDAHKALDEFEASGQYFTQIKVTDADPGFADAEPTAIAADRSGGTGDGTIYVTSGAGPGAKVLAFGPLTAPSRPPRPDLSFELENIRNVSVDSYGNRYVAVDSTIYVYGPTGKEEISIKGPKGEKGLVTEGKVDDLAVDSACNVYALDPGKGLDIEKFVYFAPDSCPPKPGTKYGPPVTCVTEESFPIGGEVGLFAVGVNPANDHVFVTSQFEIMELDSAEKGCGILKSAFGSGLGVSGYKEHIAVYGANGNVYVSSGAGSGAVWVVDPTGTELLARITGAGSPNGPFGSASGAIAVDQSNGHVLVFKGNRGVAEEYEPSGAFVAEFGSFTKSVVPRFGIAVDNSGGPNDGNVYVAYNDPENEEHPLDLTAFGPLAYGEPPIAVTGTASEVGDGNATLNGTVDSRGFDLTACEFEYLTDAQYQHNVEEEDPAFEGAASEPCAESLEEIGSGTGAVPVHADIGSLDPDGRYRFRLLAQNKYGQSPPGQAGLFGPPLVTTKPARPISYTEATLRAAIDPSGLATTYRFQYVDDATFQADQPNGFANAASTPDAQIPAGDGSVDIQVPIFGLAEGAEYHFRIVAENEAKPVPGPDQTFETQERRGPETCPNEEFRAGHSANLPDCRAYELVTPADTRGSPPYATDNGDAGRGFNNWLVTPRGQGAGESLAFFIDGTLPGFDGNGLRDGYRAVRTKGEGPHPKEGWNSQIFSPSSIEGSGGQQGIASDQEYSFWGLSPLGAFEGALAAGSYLRTPAGFELLGQGSLGADLGAVSRFVTAAGAHVIFFSKAHLEEDAPPAGTVAVYDRAAGETSAHVVSLLPGEITPGPGEDATYIGSTEDGSAIAFKLGGALYVRRDNAETVKAADAPNAFGGISEDGKRAFFADAAFSEGNADPAGLFACDVETGPCAGPEAHAPTPIAPESIFANVSADGSHVYFTSEEVLDEGGEGTPGADNLYLWDSASETTRFIAVLDPQDFVSFGGQAFMSLGDWTHAITAGVGLGRPRSPTRSTPGGELLVLQSHAQLTPYDNEGFSEVYRYDAAATPGKQLTCVSCDPTGAPPSADAMLQSFKVTHTTTLIPNATDNGQEVFFESDDPLLPEDANSVKDVYEWKAQGAGGCKRKGGCLALISSGQGEQHSFLYSMTPDGHDVFFRTQEKLVGADIPGSPSIYDARVEGGIPAPPAKALCQGDACQGQGSTPPALPSPASTGSGGGNVPGGGKPRCAKGKRRVVRRGKSHCVKRHRKKGRVG